MSNEKKRSISGEKLIASNPTARSDYFLEEFVEAGLVLTGTEVKSLRNQSPNIRDAHVEIRAIREGFEAWLLNCHIAPYTFGNRWNHEPLRRRKLLLHSHQIARLYGSVIQKGMTIVPLKMYFKSGRAKLELGLGKGKKKYDKRQELKKKSAELEIAQAKKRG